MLYEVITRALAERREAGDAFESRSDEMQTMRTELGDLAQSLETLRASIWLPQDDPAAAAG